MAQFPALPLWTDAYLADTRHLSQAEHGAYLLLLITAWRSPDCSLPNDDRLLARYAACDMRTWRHQKAAVMAFWTLGEDGRWHQKRLSKVRDNVAEMSSKRAEAGRKGAIAKAQRKPNAIALKNNDTSEAKPTACHEQTANKTQASKTKTKTTLSEGDKSPSAAGAASVEKGLFDLGRKLLGKSAGGQVKQLQKVCRGDSAQALDLLRQAEGKSSPREWIAGVIRRREQADASGEPSLESIEAQYAAMGVLL